MGALVSMSPAVACALCPACLSTYAKVVSALGAGWSISETTHHVVLTIAVASTVLISAYRSYRSRRLWPIGVALVGCALLLFGHSIESLPVEVLAILVLLGGGLLEQFRLRAAPSVQRAHAG
jgi:hypothetical protein